MKYPLKKVLSTALLLAMVMMSALSWHRHTLFVQLTSIVKWFPLSIKQQSIAQPIKEPSGIEQSIIKQEGAEQKKESVLNLALPESKLLMDSGVTLPESTHKLGNLFSVEEKEDAVKVGGHLILKEEAPQPNAAIWDKVKGVEVGVTIKTP